MKRYTIIAVAALSVLALGATDASAFLKVEGRYWLVGLGADMNVSGGGSRGSYLDLAEDLGMDDQENFFEGRVEVGLLKNHKLRYAYMPMSWDGGKTLNADITYNGVTYLSNTAVTSELDVVYHRLGYEYDLVDTLGNRLGVIFEVKYFDIDTAVSAATNGRSESYMLILPAVGVTAQVGLPLLAKLEGEITAFTMGSYGYAVDAEAGVNVSPLPFITIAGGYRYLIVSSNQGDDEFDIAFQGPFVALRAGF
ncbi:MAG TPA: hypothetical protein ENJ37_06530 [Deltaproteobacteria bacterium]|nr:hypothetical protein [Deltaproteobacteria bacterium]